MNYPESTVGDSLYSLSSKTPGKGPELSKIGFGAWAAGGAYRYGWGPTQPNEAIAAIRLALDLGITWIDTAAVYGFGHSEAVVAQAVRGRRENVFLATKGGLRRGPNDQLIRDLSPEWLAVEVAESLKRLETDYIDLYQCHWPDSAVPLEHTWGALAKQVEKGAIRYLGLSNCSLDDIRCAQEIHPVYSVQMPYNILRREIEEEIVPYCRASRIKVFAYSPMQSGLLSGSFSLRDLAEDDWRRRKAQWFQQPNLDRYLGLVDDLRPLAHHMEATVGQLLIAWCLRKRGISAAIVGARSPWQVRQNAAAAHIRLPEEYLVRIEELAASLTGRPA
jgi:aryl-alcohol dehydrogenase-like predicted oxidoreductase